MDALGTDLSRAGVQTTVYRDEQWRPLADELARTRPAERLNSPLVLIGFSYGADDAIRICRLLQKAGRQVDLLVTIDPVTPPQVPGNVARCLNYYQSNGVCDVLPWLRGVALKGGPDGPRPLNVNLRKERFDLADEGLSHATIAGNQRLRREIVHEVLRECERSLSR